MEADIKPTMNLFDASNQSSAYLNQYDSSCDKPVTVTSKNNGVSDNIGSNIDAEISDGYFQASIPSDDDNIPGFSTNQCGESHPYLQSLGYASIRDYKMRIKPLDIIRTPLFSRVWEVAKLGEVFNNRGTYQLY